MNSFPFDYLAWVVLLSPLLAAAVIGLFTQGDGRLSAQISIAAVAVAFLLSSILFLLPLDQLPNTARAGDWLSLGNLTVELGLTLDPLSLIMLVVVSGVGGAIHVYSYGYMQDDPALGRYFGSLSLFMFS